MAILPQQLGPHLDVTVFHVSQAAIDVRPLGIRFGDGQLPVEEGGVGFVGEVVKPVGGSRSHGGNLAARGIG
jgi:hypothetical protein